MAAISTRRIGLEVFYGKIKVGLLVELSIMVPSDHADHDSIRVLLKMSLDPENAQPLVPLVAIFPDL